MRTIFFLVFVASSLFFLPKKGNSQDFYDLGIKEIRVKIEDDAWAKKLNFYKAQTPEKRLLATALVDGVKFDSVGIRYKGNSSYNNVKRNERRKLPINIKLDYTIKGQAVQGKYYTLKLSNAFRDPSFVREPLAYELARAYTPAPRSSFVKVFINDQYMGLYICTESVDKHFIARHFGSEEGALFKCDPEDWQVATAPKGCTLSKEASLVSLGADQACYENLYELEFGPKKESYARLIGLINALKAGPKAAEKVLNVDQVLWMLAFNNISVNLDSYNGHLSHNYYLYCDSMGVFHPIIWDLNMAFGGFRYDGTKIMDSDGIIRLNPLNNINNEARPLIHQVLKDPFFRKLYLHHVRVMAEDFLQKGSYRLRAEEMMRLIDQTVLEDSEKLYEYQDFKNNLTKTVEAGKTPIIGITELFDNRRDFLNGLPFMKATAPMLSAHNHLKKDTQQVFSIKASGATEVLVAVRSGFIGNFKRFPMRDDGLEGDAQAGDGIFSCQITDSSPLQFYFIASGEEQITTLPARASFEYFKTNP